MRLTVPPSRLTWDYKKFLLDPGDIIRAKERQQVLQAFRALGDRIPPTGGREASRSSRGPRASEEAGYLSWWDGEGQAPSSRTGWGYKEGRPTCT